MSIAVRLGMLKAGTRSQASSLQLAAAASALVAKGGHGVAQVVTTMGEIVQQVKRVSGLIAEMKSATVQQSAGIGELSDAVMQLDGATQQSAALVQRSAESAASLREQAGRLVHSVGAFLWVAA